MVLKDLLCPFGTWTPWLQMYGVFFVHENMRCRYLSITSNVFKGIYEIYHHFSVIQSFLSKASNQVTIYDLINAHATKSAHGEINGFLTLFVMMLHIPVNNFSVISEHFPVFQC